MKFTFDDIEYTVDLDDLSVDEARLVKHHAEMGVRSWLKAIGDYDVDAWLALVLIAKKRAGEAVTWADLQDSNFMSVCISHMQAQRAQLEEQLRAAMDNHDRPVGDDEEDGEAVTPDPPKPAKAPAKKQTAGKTRKRA